MGGERNTRRADVAAFSRRGCAAGDVSCPPRGWRAINYDGWCASAKTPRPQKTSVRIQNAFARTLQAARNAPPPHRDSATSVTDALVVLRTLRDLSLARAQPNAFLKAGRPHAKLRTCFVFRQRLTLS